MDSSVSGRSGSGWSGSGSSSESGDESDGDGRPATEAGVIGGRAAAPRGAPPTPARITPRKQARGAAPVQKRVGVPAWSFAFFSERGGQPATDAGLTITTNARAKLTYRVPEDIGKNAVLEGQHALKQAKVKRERAGLPVRDDGKLTALDCFALAVPEPLLDLLVEFAQGAKTFDMQDLVKYLKAEVGMRMTNSSTKAFFDGHNEELARAHRVVVNALRQGDRPAARKESVDVLAPLGPHAFDPLLDKMVEACSEHWSKIFFIASTTSIDIDDDKLHHGSELWREYGFTTQPCKDKKKRPVNNIVASAGGGFVLRVMPDKLGSQRAKLIEGAIDKLLPKNHAARNKLVVLQDRGYFQLTAGTAAAGAASGDCSNIIKVLQNANVRFFGTAKKSKINAFEFVDKEDEAGPPGQLQINTFGARSSFVASANMTEEGKRGNEQLVMTAVRQGDTKRRGALIITNKIDNGEALELAYVLEPRYGADPTGPGGVQRVAHAQVVEGPRPDKTQPVALAEHEHQRMLSAVYEYTREQRSADWRLARVGVFTSSGVFTVVDCLDAFFLDTDELKALHASCIATACITPSSDILLLHASNHYPRDMPATQGGVARVRRAAASKSDDRFWLAAKYKLESLKAECRNNGVMTTGKETRKALASMLASFFGKQQRKQPRTGADEEEEEEEEEEEVEVEDAAAAAEEVGEGAAAEEAAEKDKEESRAETSKAFTQLLNKVWHLKPIHTSVEGPLEIGTKAEPLALHSLPALVQRASQGRYKVERQWEHGLIGRRDAAVAVTSPDAVIALSRLVRDDETGTCSFQFHALAVLELKTSTTQATISAATTNTVQLGPWKECDAATDEFKTLVPNAGHRVQAVHHAAVLDVGTVVMMFSSPGAADSATRFVMVSVHQPARAKWLKYLATLATRHMPFLTGEGVAGMLPDLGPDQSPPYGYASDHHTAELHLKLARAYRQDVIAFGTPPPARRLIAAQSAMWNKSMGLIDVLRKIVKSQRKQHVRDQPGLLFIGVLLDYCLLNAFRVYQFARLEKQLSDKWTLSKLTRERAEITSYVLFLQHLFNELQPEDLLKYYPGAEARLAGILKARRAAAKVVQQQPEAAGQEPVRKIWRFVNERTLTSTRLSGPRHVADRLQGPKRNLRGLCVLCCTSCEEKVDHAHRRMGRKTSQFCSRCKLFVCKNCWVSFHTEQVLSTPLCCKATRLRGRGGPGDEGPGSEGDDESDEREGPAKKPRRV